MYSDMLLGLSLMVFGIYAALRPDEALADRIGKFSLLPRDPRHARRIVVACGATLALAGLTTIMWSIF